jgi:hypothetical protein
LKHLAWTLWVPKESMLAMAARIEVVFILLIGSEFCLCLCFGMVTLLKQERKEVSEVGATGCVYICVRWHVGRPWGVDHVLRPEKDFLVSCSASHGIVSFQILCYRTLPPFTPCKASYIHFSWSYRCLHRRSVLGRCIACQYIHGCDYIRAEVKGRTHVTQT